jgi:peroxiredoxin
MRDLFVKGMMLIALSLQLAGCWGMPARIQELVGQPAPETRLMALDGSELPLSAYRGQYVSLLFWATWCKHSRGAIEEFEDLARQFARRKDMAFLAVSVDRNEDFEILKQRIASQDLRTMTHKFSGNDLFDEAYMGLRGEAVPYVVLIDRRGVVRHVGNSVGELEGVLDDLGSPYK